MTERGGTIALACAVAALGLWRISCAAPSPSGAAGADAGAGGESGAPDAVFFRSENSQLSVFLEPPQNPESPVPAQSTSQQDATQAATVADALKAALSAMSRNDLKTARSEWTRALEADPSNLTALVNIAWIAQREKRWEESESFLKKAVRIAPENAAVWMALGNASLEQSRLDQAVAHFAQAVALDPGSARAHRFFALALGRRGWLGPAEEELRKSLEIEPGDPGAHFNLAVFYLQQRPPAVELARRHYYKARDLGFAPDPEIEKTLNAAPAP